MELMVVVILIGILTVMAMPTMAEAHANARTLDDATRIAELYRAGRTRAIGRGAAMLVQMASANRYNSFNATPTNAAGGLGVFFLYEAQVTGTGFSSLLPLPGGSPLSSCGSPATVWPTIIANASSSLMDEVTLNTTAEQTYQIWSTLNDDTGVVPTAGSLCYTPLGRTYYQPTATPVFTPGAGMLRGELQISVQRSGIGGPVTGITRTVIVPDSGSTRIVSR
jgi:type II secretory pathway pseudopilin PulG